MAARQPFDYIVCAQKIGRDQTSTIQELRRIVGPSTTLVSAQNGLDVEVPLRDAFPRNTVLSAICNIGCTQSRPGFVQQTARIRKEAFLIGIHSPSGQGAATDVFHRDRLSAVDHAFESTDFVLQERWRKLVFNNAWNPVAALTGLDTHQLLAAPHAIKFVQQLATEACEVAAASGVILDKELPAKVIELARRSAPICPSTLQDARNHRPMELEPMFGEWKNTLLSTRIKLTVAPGYLVSQAPIVGVPTPCTSMMYGLLQQRNAAFISLDHKARKPLAPSTVMDGLMAMSVPAGLAY